jgi:hypothetical protein
MTSPQEFLDFISSLPSPRVPLHGNPGRTIDLQTLARDLPDHDSLLSWWKGKNMPPHLSNTVAKTILELNPPEDVRAAMLFLMM